MCPPFPEDTSTVRLKTRQHQSSHLLFTSEPNKSIEADAVMEGMGNLPVFYADEAVYGEQLRNTPGVTARRSCVLLALTALPVTLASS